MNVQIVITTHSSYVVSNAQFESIGYFCKQNGNVIIKDLMQYKTSVEIDNSSCSNNTAVKTAKKIKEAEGGVLFIDEAYSLDSNSTIDYGREVVNTLVKHMEDKRDNLVVIFAGYPKEMSKFITMNPGLRGRIQFKLEFVDYKPNKP